MGDVYPHRLPINSHALDVFLPTGSVSRDRNGPSSSRRLKFKTIEKWRANDICRGSGVDYYQR